MTHIDAKAANIGLGSLSETSGEAESVLSPEALALFSSLLVQMQAETNGNIENTDRLASSAVTSPVTETTIQPDTTSNHEKNVGAAIVDSGSMDIGDMANLTEILVATQQIVGASRTASEEPTNVTPIDKTIFSDVPMTETTTIATQLMQQAAAALIDRKQMIEGVEGPVPRTAYDSKTLSNRELTVLLQAAMRPVLKEFEEKLSPAQDTASVASETITDFDPQIAIDLAINQPLADTVSTKLQEAYHPSGHGPTPLQLANLVQGPPQVSGQGPMMPELVKQIQGPPQVSGQGPMMPELAKQMQGPQQVSGQGPMMPELAKQIQGPPQVSGQGPIMPERAKKILEPLPIQRPLIGAGSLAAKPLTAQSMITQGDATDAIILSEEAALTTPSKAELIGKSGIKNEIKSSQSMPDGLRSDRIMTQAETMTMAHISGASRRAVTPPMMFELSRQLVAETSSDSNNQSQQSTTSSTSTAQQQSGQSGGNASGQQGREAPTGVDSGQKSVGGERVAVYRLNVQQNGWADTMVRRLQTSLNNGTGAIRIILEPRNLGRLQVNMDLRDGRAKIRIAADTMQAASLLRDSRAQLAQMFEQSGLRLTSIQTTTAIINGDGSAVADGGGSQMFADQQTSGKNANKDGKNSEHGNKLLSDGASAGDIEIDTTTALLPGETAVLNVLA